MTTSHATHHVLFVALRSQRRGTAWEDISKGLGGAPAPLLSAVPVGHGRVLRLLGVFHTAHGVLHTLAQERLHREVALLAQGPVLRPFIVNLYSLWPYGLQNDHQNAG